MFNCRWVYFEYILQFIGRNYSDGSATRRTCNYFARSPPKSKRGRNRKFLVEPKTNPNSACWLRVGSFGYDESLIFQTGTLHLCPSSTANGTKRTAAQSSVKKNRVGMELVLANTEQTNAGFKCSVRSQPFTFWSCFWIVFGIVLGIGGSWFN